MKTINEIVVKMNRYSLFVIFFAVLAISCCDNASAAPNVQTYAFERGSKIISKQIDGCTYHILASNGQSRGLAIVHSGSCGNQLHVLKAKGQPND